MYYLQHIGYGYSKRICEDVTDWFLTKFLPRHKLFVTISHRGLMREDSYGWCDLEDDTNKPRTFKIELHSRMEKSLYVQTLLHELVHVRQWVKGDLKMKKGKMYCKVPNTDKDYKYAWSGNTKSNRMRRRPIDWRRFYIRSTWQNKRVCQYEKWYTIG